MDNTDNQNDRAAQSRYPDPEASQAQVFRMTSQQYASPYGNLSLDTARAEFEASTARQRSLGREEPKGRSGLQEESESEEGDFLQELVNGEDDQLSDADSDYRDVQAGIAKFKDDVLRFRADQRRDSNSDGEEWTTVKGRSARRQARGSGRPRGKRGPHKPAEPTGDIKARLSKAYEAFMEEDYATARDIVDQIICINAETHEAWQLLASIFQELGDTNNTFKALMIACNMRPKDVNAWLYCVSFALDQTGKDRDGYLRSAHHCYSSAIRANPKSVDARVGKSDLFLEQGNTFRAVSGYEMVLKLSPHNLEVLKRLAAAYIEHGDIKTAINRYKQSISHYKACQNLSEPPFGWSDLNVYIELYGHSGRYQDAVQELKSLSRWLVGRDEEEYWDEVTSDDREWDDDNIRRTDCPDFIPTKFPLSAYGRGLPLELRVKLGLYRLRLGNYREAMNHFNRLDPTDRSGEGICFEYPDLLRVVADGLYKANLHRQALTFYKPLEKVDGQSTTSLHIAMGKCYLKDKLTEQAEECFKAAIKVEDGSIEARMQLAKIYEEAHQPERAMFYVKEMMSLVSIPLSNVVQKRPRLRDPPPECSGQSFEHVKPERRSHGKPRRVTDLAERTDEAELADFLQRRFFVMRTEHERMRAGNEESTRAWMEAAKDLIDDFRGCKPFYPWDKYVRFLGYGGDDGLQTQAFLDTDLTAMADRLCRDLGHSEKAQAAVVGIPADYRGLPFDAWLDIFLEYSLCLARAGRNKESYETCEAAKDSIVFFQSREHMFLIHICWCMCALLANDEENCVAVARFFTKEYQFVTDSYRLFGAVTRICQSPISWYNSGPSQKYILRQIKAMDYSLVDKATQDKYFADKGSYSAEDENEQQIINTDMDIALLMLYGYILYTGTSYAYALNYFYRAHSLDPSNPVIHLSIGLAYIHFALKRQSDNRQYLILQGLAFLLRYYDNRKQSSKVEERQEAHYNIARAYHMLGLTNLAVPYYKRVLEEVSHEGSLTREDLEIDVAYNLQTIYSLGGNYTLARAITEKYLGI